MAANVLSKKLRHGGVARSPLPDTDLIGESLARRVEDRLRPLVKTLLRAELSGGRVTKLASATGALVTPTLMGVVEIEDADTPALIAADPDLVFHLIDLTLGGDPATAPVPVARILTAIDMALGRLHLEAMIEAFGEAIGASLGQPLTKALRLRDQRQTLSQLRLAPDYIDVLVFRITLTLGEGGRRGAFDLILPLSALDVIRASIADNAVRAQRDRPNDLWKTLMRRAAASAPVTVDAVLHRLTLPLSALQELAVGQVIEIPRQSTDAVQITISQPGGRAAPVATGHLGTFQEHKVVKLAAAPDRRMIAHIDRALRAGSGAVPVPAPAEIETASLQSAV